MKILTPKTLDHEFTSPEPFKTGNSFKDTPYDTAHDNVSKAQNDSQEEVQKQIDAYIEKHSLRDGYETLGYGWKYEYAPDREGSKDPRDIISVSFWQKCKFTQKIITTLNAADMTEDHPSSFTERLAADRSAPNTSKVF